MERAEFTPCKRRDLERAIDLFLRGARYVRYPLGRTKMARPSVTHVEARQGLNPVRIGRMVYLDSEDAFVRLDHVDLCASVVRLVSDLFVSASAVEASRRPARLSAPPTYAFLGRRARSGFRRRSEPMI